MVSQPPRWCVVASDVVETYTVKFLVGVTTFSVRRPWVSIFSCMAFSLVCAVGFLNFHIETEGTKIWQEQDTDIQDDFVYVAETFPSQYEIFRFIFVGEQDGSNVLTLTALDSMFDVWEEFIAVTAGGLGFQDVCRQSSLGCTTTGILRFFKNNRTYYESTVASQSDLLATLSADRYPDGAPVDRQLIFAHWTDDENGILQSATLARLDIFVMSGSRDWVKGVLETFVDQKEQLVTRSWPGIRVALMSMGSLDDELSRSVSADIVLFSMAFCLMSVLTAVLLGRPLHRVKGRRLLGALDYLIVCFAVLAGYGISMAFGVPFTVLQQALPFILVGIGMDDAFVIVGSFDQTDPSQPIEDRMKDTIRRVGMSVTLTSATDIVAFLLATSSAFPAVQYFGIYAAFSCLFVWFFHISAFCAMLSLDAKRQNANRFDCVFCLKASAAQETTDAKGPWSNLAGRLLASFIRRLVGNLVVRLFVVFAFVAVAAVSFWQTMEDLSTNFILTDLCPDVSYVRDFLTFEMEGFGSDTLGQAVRVGLYFPNTDHGSANVQAAMLMATEESKGLKYVRDELEPSWLYDFTSWALNDGLATGVVDTSDFADADECTDVGGIGCRFVVGDALGPAVAHYVSLEVGESRAEQVVFDSDTNPTRIVASVMFIRLVDMSGSKEMVNALEEMEDWVDSIQGTLPGMMASAHAFGWWDQFRIIIEELMRSISLCMVAVVILSFIVLKSPLAVLLVLITLILVFIDLVGCILLWGLHLNSISMINLLMAVGLVVDYSMHIAHCFCMQDPSLTRPERVVKSMEEIGGAVFLGVGSTFVAILPLSLAGSEVFRVFFKMFLSITVVGGSHGIIFLPVILSLVGPKPHVVKSESDDHVPKTAWGS